MATQGLKVLVIEDDIQLGCALARGIKSEGHEVEAVADGRKAIERLSVSKPDVILTDWLVPHFDGMAVLHYALGLPFKPRVLVHSGLTHPDARAYALREGAESFHPKPTSLNTLIKAIEAAPVRSSGAPIVEASPAIRKLLTSRFWIGLGGLARDHLDECTGLSLRESTMTSPHDNEVRSSFCMVDPASATEVHVSIRASMESGSKLARVLMGIENANRDIIADMLKELCNNLVGSAKTSLAETGASFTIGVSAPDESLDRPFVADKLLVLEASGVRLVVEVGLRMAQSCSVKAAGLCENMILIDDVRTESGALLMPAGMRLTAASAERIARRIPSQTIRVVSL